MRIDHAGLACTNIPNGEQEAHMANPAYKRVMEVVAAAADGSTYRIDRYCSQPPGDAKTSSYCCLPDGQLVTWEGDGHYKLPDGTIVTMVASRLCQ
ncbi:hypothetical protein [Achromobacter animicus]|uniref:hypothetical protein n=1 Tax=Achromobacter animicus TaxID=1389935 RepID=UPI0015836DB4|nr:hypothetical protein [Achromobacter animicus]